MARTLPVLMVLLLAPAGPALGTEIDRLEVTHEDGTYSLDLEARLDAPADAVYDALTDLDHLDRLSQAIVRSRRLEEVSDGQPLVRMVTEGCVAFFCRTLVRVMRVHEQSDLRATIEVLPERSDFRSGSSSIRVQADGPGSRLELLVRMTPDIWLPPVIGPWQVKKNIRWHYRRMVHRLEHLGAGEPVPAKRPPSDSPPDPTGGTG